MEYPGAIIFCNANISESSLSLIKLQLFVNQTISLDQFILDSSNYISLSKLNQRILVLIDDFENTELRETADVLIYIKMGLVTILKNNFGPCGISLDINKVYIHKLLRKASEYKL